jgi:hypothetical protein
MRRSRSVLCCAEGIKNVISMSTDICRCCFILQEAIFRVVAAILHLGNINFAKGTENDSSVIKDDKSRFHLNTAAELLK